MMRTRGAKKKSKHDVERIKSIQKKSFECTLIDGEDEVG